MTLADTEARAREVSVNGIKNARRDRTMSDVHNPTTLSMGELVVELTTYRRDLRHLRHSMATKDARDAAETIAFAWEFADADESTVAAKGGDVLRLAQKIDANLAEVERLLAEIRHKAALASEAVADSEAKRRTQRARLVL